MLQSVWKLLIGASRNYDASKSIYVMYIPKEHSKEDVFKAFNKLCMIPLIESARAEVQKSASNLSIELFQSEKKGQDIHVIDQSAVFWHLIF